MRPTTGVLGAVVVLLAGWTMVVRTQAQAPPAPRSSDIMPALLEEVRGLRTALEQMNAAGPRIQLALGRLQIQEQRMNTAIKRVDDVRSKLAQVQREYGETQQAIGMMEAAFKEGRLPSGHEGPSQQELEEIRRHHKQRLTSLASEVQRLTLEESGYAAEVATEQGRWTDLNQRLEDLERQLRPLK